jgi:hypothetical protein
MDDEHVKKTYDDCIRHFSNCNTKADVCILEYVCRYHHCVNHKFKTDRLLKDELSLYFNVPKVYNIMHLIKQFELMEKGRTYPHLQVYLDALLESHSAV